MYWKRATTAGAYAAIVISLVLPVADIVARRIYATIAPQSSFLWEPKYTGFGTYLIAAVALIAISLMSAKKTKYWDLGETVRELNRAD